MVTADADVDPLIDSQLYRRSIRSTETVLNAAIAHGEGWRSRAHENLCEVDEIKI